VISDVGKPVADIITVLPLCHRHWQIARVRLKVIEKDELLIHGH